MKNYIFTLLLPCWLWAACNTSTGESNQGNENRSSEQAAQQANASEAPEEPAAPISFNFEQASTGTLPEGWSAHVTGRGKKPVWQVIDDKGNKVLAQLSEDNPSNHFNVVVYDEWEAKNVVLITRFKGVRGKIDQGGGFVWRFQDPDNYYIVRANPLENNVVLYKVENGKRTDLPLLGKGRTYGTEAPVPTNQWHTLKLEAKDKMFTVWVNNQQLFQVEDDTFTSAGKVGFWTKADAVTYFDDFNAANE
ncbi:MAG: polysaccharide lyase [Bacteroidetes bacterium]|nr:polysaccharide lyase [Bacteroidota bacterium]